MRITKYILLTLFWLLTTSCVTSSLQIDSVPPGAEILLTLENQPPKKIGVSPLQLGTTDLAVLSDSFLLTIQKTGFKSESVLVSSKSVPYHGHVGVQLHEDLASSGSLNLETSLDEVARGVAQVWNLIRSKEYEQAQNILSTLTSKYPTVATLYGLEGNIYYLQKSIDKALASYQKSNRLSANAETQRMITRLEELRGRSPSSTGRQDQ